MLRAYILTYHATCIYPNFYLLKELIGLKNPIHEKRAAYQTTYR